MKTKTCFFISFLALLTLSTNSYSKCWRVNNRSGINADFTNLQSAIDTAIVLPGDTVYLEASLTCYGSIICNKKLIIIGTGYFLAQNPETQATPVTATICGDCGYNAVIFAPGSEGSKIIGVTITSCFYWVQMQIKTSDICIQRCDIEGFIYLTDTTDNLTIIQSYIGAIFNSGGAGSNLLFSNNIIGYASLDINYGGTFLNNVIISDGSYPLGLNNFIIQNNILTNPGVVFNFNGNCNYSYNMGTATQFGTLNNNLSNIAADSIFVCWSDCSGSSKDGRYALRATSPAKGTGFGGIDMGIYGGSSPYILSGMPDVPAIYEFSIGNNNDSIKINVKAKSHQ